MASHQRLLTFCCRSPSSGSSKSKETEAALHQKMMDLDIEMVSHRNPAEQRDNGVDSTDILLVTLLF